MANISVRTESRDVYAEIPPRIGTVQMAVGKYTRQLPSGSSPIQLTSRTVLLSYL